MKVGGGSSALVVAIAAALVLGACALAAVAAGSSHQSSLLTVSVPAKQTIQDLQKGKFVQIVSCRRACRVTTTLLVGARTLNPRLTGPAGEKLVVIASGHTSAAANKKVRLGARLNKVGQTSLRHVGSMQLIGRVNAVGTASRADTGSANWNMIIRRT